MSAPYLLSRLLARLLLSCFVKIRVHGAEATGRPGAFILAANHISHFDPPLIAVAARRKLDWMAMIELFENPLAGWWLRAIDAFPVDRARTDRGAVRTALRRLRHGRAVGIFPEGGIRDGAESLLAGGRMRSGLSAFARLSGAPVIPCVILGSDRLYAARAWWPFRQVTVWIAFGSPIYCPSGGKNARESLEAALTGAFRALLTELQGRFGLTADDLPHSPAHRKGRL